MSFSPWKNVPWAIYMKHASLRTRRYAMAWSRQVTARIRSWWLNGTVSLWRIHAACSEFWLLGCNHKSNTGSKDQKQKYTKERSHEDTHHGFDYNFQRRLWNTSRGREWEHGVYIYMDFQCCQGILCSLLSKKKKKKQRGIYWYTQLCSEELHK